MTEGRFEIHKRPRGARVRRGRIVQGHGGQVMRNADVRTVETRAPERAEIVAALATNAAVRADDIDVAVSGQCVTLSGTVGTCAERREAERVVWSLPGVKIVHDLIMIGSPPPGGERRWAPAGPDIRR